MIRRLALATAALVALGAVGAPVAGADEKLVSKGPKVGCVWVFDTSACIDNPWDLLPVRP